MESIHLSSVTPPSVFKKIKGVIFDCDGVLIDSIDANIWYYNFFKKKFGLDPLTEEEIRYVHAHTVFESIRHVVPEKYHEEALEMRKDPALAEALNHIKIEEGLRGVLEWLQSRNIRMGINTNRTDTLPTVLSNLEIKDYFSPMVTATLLPNSKPHPEGVHYILEKWRMKPTDVVYIGDTWVDETCAQAAGVEFWAYRNADLNARIHISDYQVLQQALGRASREVWPNLGCGCD